MAPGRIGILIIPLHLSNQTYVARMKTCWWHSGPAGGRIAIYPRKRKSIGRKLLIKLRPGGGPSCESNICRQVGKPCWQHSGPAGGPPHLAITPLSPPLAHPPRGISLDIFPGGKSTCCAAKSEKEYYTGPTKINTPAKNKISPGNWQIPASLQASAKYISL